MWLRFLEKSRVKFFSTFQAYQIQIIWLIAIFRYSSWWKIGNTRANDDWSGASI